jgi:hypothetical protein
VSPYAAPDVPSAGPPSAAARLTRRVFGRPLPPR